MVTRQTRPRIRAGDKTSRLQQVLPQVLPGEANSLDMGLDLGELIETGRNLSGHGVRGVAVTQLLHPG